MKDPELSPCHRCRTLVARSMRRTANGTERSIVLEHATAYQIWYAAGTDMLLAHPVPVLVEHRHTR